MGVILVEFIEFVSSGMFVATIRHSPLGVNIFCWLIVPPHLGQGVLSRRWGVLVRCISSDTEIVCNCASPCIGAFVAICMSVESSVRL